MKKRKRKSHLLRSLEARVAHLRAEARDPYTKKLGPAAVRSVTESLDVWRRELGRVRRAERK